MPLYHNSPLQDSNTKAAKATLEYENLRREHATEIQTVINDTTNRLSSLELTANTKNQENQKKPVFGIQK